LHAAINGVMAGCRPEYFPVLDVLDAFEAGGSARTGLMQSTSAKYACCIAENEDVRSLHGALVVIGPEHAQLLAQRGWSKQHVREHLFERFGKTRKDLIRFGKDHPDFAELAEATFIKSAASPDSIIVFVAGANNAGVSTVCPSITIGRGSPARESRASVGCVPRTRASWGAPGARRRRRYRPSRCRTRRGSGSSDTPESGTDSPTPHL
jgi:hypothetical protein